MAARVVSLVPSVTETLRALGADVVACTRFCEQPDLPTVGGTKDPDLAAIIGARPDVVVMNDEENRRVDAEALAAAGLAVHDCSPRTVADVGPAVAGMAERLGLAVPAPFGLDEWPAWLDRHPEPPQARAVFVPIWRRPWMSIGPATYGASLLRRLGWRTVFTHGSDRYPSTTLEEVAARHPALVLVPSEPYPFRDRHRAELTEAFGSVPVVPVDGRDLFWWGIRTPGALRRLEAVLGGAVGDL